MSQARVLRLFEGFGIELEYMVVHDPSLDVFPAVDEVFKAVTGTYAGDYEDGPIAWSNELALHVIEFKTNGPVASLDGQAALFHQSVGRVNELLKPLGGRLMPGGAHPWMDPQREMRLWPHECSPVYEAFNRIFDCRGHGWSNLQACHINLPFSNDEDFGRLHAAIRVLLPILPALAASSPLLEAQPTGWLDARLREYRGNCARIPSISGSVIPEPVFSMDAYQQQILRRLYADIQPHDPDGILQDEFLNARGAIARFHRNAIEIRVLDVQEAPRADLAAAALIIWILRHLVEEQAASYARQRAMAQEPLVALFTEVARLGAEALISDPDYLRLWGLPSSVPLRAGQLWGHLVAKAQQANPESAWGRDAAQLVAAGPLAGRILRALNGRYDREHLQQVYRRMCNALDKNEFFRP